MTTQSPSTRQRPAFRLCFAAQTGNLRDGRPELSYPVEIGACFHRKDPSKGLVARFTLIPEQMREGVLLLMPVEPAADTSGELFDAAAVEAGR